MAYDNRRHNIHACQIAGVRLILFLAFVSGISGCAWNSGTDPRTSRASQPNQTLLKQTRAEAGQVLLNVRLKGRFDLPQAVVLDYSRTNDDALESTIGMLQRGLSGQYGDYPILLKLSAGRYRLKSLRIAGQSRNAEGALLARLSKIFAAVGSDTRYIGRLIISGSGNDPVAPQSISWENHYQDDSLLAKTISKALRDQKITDDGVKTLYSLNRTSTEPQITISSLGPSILSTLSREQKPFFKRYLRSAHPRAFAIDNSGEAGFASGDDAINQALARCGRRGNIEKCRIIAFDDVIVTPHPSDQQRPK